MSFGTTQIFLTTYAFISIPLMILALAIIGVMVRIENKSTATRFLLVFFIGLLVNSLALFLSNSAAFYPFIFKTSGW